MLEKKVNDISISKLRAILLLEADFNIANKIIFNTHLIPQMESQNEIPREIIGDHWSQSTIQLAVNKKLFVDIANQSKTPYVIISTDVSNYFDRVVHLVSTITCIHFGLPQDYLFTFYETIQNMQMYLLTAHSMLSLFYTYSALNPFQDLIQGNEAASPSFLLITILLI